MKLIKTTKYHYIYQLSDREAKKLSEIQEIDVDCVDRFYAFLKENYEDYKPTFDMDMGYEDFSETSLANILDCVRNY